MEDTYSSKVISDTDRISYSNKSSPLRIQHLENLTISNELRGSSNQLEDSHSRYPYSQTIRPPVLTKQRSSSIRLTGSSMQSNPEHEKRLNQIQQKLNGKKLMTESIENEITALRKNLLKKSQEGNQFITNLEESHDRILKALRNQIASLKQQHEYNTTVNGQEIQRVKEEYDSKIRLAERDRANVITSAKDKLETTQKAYLNQNEQLSETRHLSSIMSIQHDENIKALNNQTRDLTSQVEQYKQKLTQISQLEIPKIEREKKDLIKDHERTMSSFKIDHEKNIIELENKVDLKELQIEKLEYEIADIRRKLVSKFQEGDRYVQQLQEKLISSQRNLDIYKQDAKRLANIQQDVVNERKILKNESALLKHEYSRIRKENRRFKKDCSQLGGLVYGKLSVSPMKKSAKILN